MLFAWLTLEGETRCLACTGCQGCIAQATLATCCGDELHADGGQVSQGFTLGIQHDSACRYLKDEVFTPGAVAVSAGTVGSTWSLHVRVVVEIEQGVNLGSHLKDDVTAMSTIAAVGAAQGLEFFTVHRDTAVASVACGEMKNNAVNKAVHKFGVTPDQR